jgi:superfamily I DNA and/or RNA helicase
MKSEHDNHITIENKLPGMPGFIQTLAGYYSQFLETDFKKSREPKRKFANRDAAGRKVGIHFSRYPRLKNVITEIINQKQDIPDLVIKSGQYKSDLPISIETAIFSAIDAVSLQYLVNDFVPFKEKIIQKLTATEIDIEAVMEYAVNQMMNIVDTNIVSPVLDIIAPVFERQNTNSTALDQLITYSEEISKILIKDAEEQLPTAISSIAFKHEQEDFDKLMEELQNEIRIKDLLKNYFSDFATSDVFTDLRELVTTFKTAENLQFYLNFGEVNFKKSKFPLYFLPININIDKSKIHIILEPHIYVNKKAIEFLIGEINRSQVGTNTINPLTERIFYKESNSSYVEIANQTLHNILTVLQVKGEVNLTSSGKTIGTGALRMEINNEISISLADKSDESIVNDYEALISGLDEDSPLLKAFHRLIEGFLTENPLSIENSIDKSWQDTEITERLVFQSPLPLAEEQRKILSAIRNKDSRFISVEGPPGTGKSHTIAAIAFEMILKGENILILSDKKEALDVVEGKLNDVIGKVRGVETDYVNPILRLGKSGSNYSNIVKQNSINKLKSNLQAFEARAKEFDEEYRNSEDRLKNDIKRTISSVQKIDLEKIFNFYQDEHKFIDENPNIEDFYIDSDDLETLINMAEIVDKNRQGFAYFFSKDSSVEKIEEIAELATLISSIPEDIKYILKECPELKIDELHTLSHTANSIQELEIPLFGYFFAKSSLSHYSQRIYDITGLSLSKPQDELNKLRTISTIDSELSLVLNNNGKNGSDADSKEVLYRSAINKIHISYENQETIRDYLELDYEYLEAIEVPYLIKDLLALKSNTGSILNRCKELYNKRREINTEFSNIPEFDYHTSKTNIETLNAQRLTNTIDKRVIDFATHKKADAKTLQQIIRNKSKFPTDKFDLLKQAFPCMIAGLRDYAEFIPFEADLFSLIIIDEASQVSIAQALPAILRSKKMVVMGDRKQFSNVKTSNASKALNQGYFSDVNDVFKKTVAKDDDFLITKCDSFNIKNSVMDFFETISNFSIQLRKHFRGYPEMISFSSKYFYDGYLQALKIRGKPIEDVFEFIEVEDLDRIETTKNANKQEAELIINKLLEMIKEDSPLSVAIITPFTQQQKIISTMISEHSESDIFQKKLKIAVFTFDTCQGEERDVIFYSMVANRQKDLLNYIFPTSLSSNLSEDEIDGKLKFQRLNVGFSRGKEKLVFVLSKPIEEFSGSIGQALRHYKGQLENSFTAPDPSEVDQSSPMEAKLLEWIQQTSFYTTRNESVEIVPQFEIGKYLKALDSTYVHPNYKVDFLLRIKTEKGIYQVILEYDGFEHHFTDRDKVNAMNWKTYLTPEDVERECILEGYGYKMLRINRFNLGNDPISTLDNRLINLLNKLDEDFENEMIKSIQKDTEERVKGLKEGTHKECNKCKKIKPKVEFFDASLKSQYGINCRDCKLNSGRSPSKNQKNKNSTSSSSVDMASVYIDGRYWKSMPKSQALKAVKTLKSRGKKAKIK